MAYSLRRLARISVLLAVAALATAFSQTAPPDLDAWVARTMKEFEIPGVAVAIVKDGKVVAAKGYGVRRLGDPGAVDEHTRFGIASNSKAFTAASMAMLVDEGKVSWDDPVQKYLPSFQMYDPYVTRELTVRDLLCHRGGLGLGAGDLLFWPNTDVTRDQVVSAVRNIRPASSLRSRYAYNNLMFVVAGQVIAAVSGKSWDEFVRERILTPLGMTETTIGSAGFGRQDNAASPHARGWRPVGMLKPVEANRDETWAAAAGLRANATDLAKWLTAHLNGGMAGGKRLWSQAAARQMWSVQIPLPTPEPRGALKSTRANFSGYGLGWNVRDYRGKKLVSHGGGLTGMVTTVQLMPEENLGCVVLTNQEESGALSAIAYHILDYYLAPGEAEDWITAFRSMRQESVKRALAEEERQASGRAANTKPSLEPAKYAGDYTDSWYGRATVALENGKLVLRMTHTPSMVGDLEHWQYDTFKAVFRDDTIPDAFVTFVLGPTGAIDQMKMVPTSSLADFSFDYQDLLFSPVKARR